MRWGSGAPCAGRPEPKGPTEERTHHTRTQTHETQPGAARQHNARPHKPREHSPNATRRTRSSAQQRASPSPAFNLLPPSHHLPCRPTLSETQSRHTLLVRRGSARIEGTSSLNAPQASA
eukprot:9143626-Heterocapsa_arctica.AAC.1